MRPASSNAVVVAVVVNVGVVVVGVDVGVCTLVVFSALVDVVAITPTELVAALVDLSDEWISVEFEVELALDDFVVVDAVVAVVAVVVAIVVVVDDVDDVDVEVDDVVLVAVVVVTTRGLNIIASPSKKSSENESSGVRFAVGESAAINVRSNERKNDAIAQRLTLLWRVFVFFFHRCE